MSQEQDTQDCCVCSLCMKECSDDVAPLIVNMVFLACNMSSYRHIVKGSYCQSCFSVICSDCTVNVFNIRSSKCYACGSHLKACDRDVTERLPLLLRDFKNLLKDIGYQMNHVADEHSTNEVSLDAKRQIVQIFRNTAYICELSSVIRETLQGVIEPLKNYISRNKSVPADLTTHKAYKSIKGPAHEHRDLFEGGFKHRIRLS